MLIDNKTTKVVDLLQENIKSNNKLSIMTGLFSIFAFDKLKSGLNQIDSCRLIFSQFTDMFDITQTTNPFNSMTGGKFEVRLRNQLNQKQIAKEFTLWLNNKAEIKLLKQKGAISNHVIHIDGKEPTGFMGAQFSGSGLGMTESESLDMITYATDANETQQMINWFDMVWNNPNQLEKAKSAFMAEVSKLTQDQSPQSIYFLTLYHLFNNFIDDLDEDRIIRNKTGFKDTLVWNKLYQFQKDGVMGAIEKLERYNGCIIADSVGLGKTFEALAVIKYYELRNDRVLVLCPKKLRDNWTVYTINDKRNLLADDRFNYDVLNHTDMSRVKGYSGEINLETLNWGNYDLLVIDESHNFRNRPNKTKGKSRYERLMQEVIRSGVKTKVLMLSATPVNNRMNDLKNQVAFITEGKDTALADDGIKSIDNTLRLAQIRFNQWSKQPASERKVESLLDMMNFDYFKLLDIMTIARSRKHIEKYYDISEMGKFPLRLKPINIKSDIDLSAKFPPLKEVNKTIKRLTLAGYAPLKYVRMDKKAEYHRRYDREFNNGKVIFKQVDREESLVHLIRINLLKRMESSIHSFHLTVEKLLFKVQGLIDKITSHEDGEFDEFSIEDILIESPEYEQFLIGNKIKVLLQDIDLIRFRQDLEADKVFLNSLVKEASEVDVSRDAKLADVKQQIYAKINNPINEANKKIVIFTAFADTAEYLYQHIKNWAQSELNLYSAIITGSGTNRSTMPKAGHELNMLLTHFSPRSKERDKIVADAQDQIDILIATDCISEGQNLQDCDYLINYDIHWNPVRIIQRFGRIDRLGSINTSIQLVNFWPNMELDEYINLEARVSGRMVLLDISATGEENVIEQDAKEMNDLEYRKRQLQQLQDAVVDLEDMTGGVSITDLTLNDFRMDLTNHMKTHLIALESSPLGLFSAVLTQISPISSVISDTTNNDLHEQELTKGIIFCLKDIKGTVQVDSNYPLSPYYMVYIDDTGEVIYSFTQAKKILDVMKNVCFVPIAIQEEAMQESLLKEKANECLKQAYEIYDTKPLSHYQHLLEKAVESIAGKSEEKGVESLFSRGGTVLSQETAQTVNDFEVVSYTVLV